MTRKKHFSTPILLMGKPHVANKGLELLHQETLGEWSTRSELASSQATEILEAWEALGQGMFCDWLEQQQVDVLTISRLIDISEAKGRSGAAARAADAKWRAEHGSDFDDVLAAWQRNIEEPVPKSRIAFSEEWSLELERRGRPVSTDAIYDSWLGGRSLPRRPSKAKR